MMRRLCKVAFLALQIAVIAAAAHDGVRLALAQ